MTESEFRNLLSEALYEYLDNDYGDDVALDRVSTFREHGLLTSDDGLVVRLADGSEFQVTVVRSAGPDEDDESAS